MHLSNLNSSEYQYFIYSILLLVMLLSGLASRRDLAFSKILKYLAIWSAIAVVAIALYSYRFEFSDFKNRILGEINPSSTRINKDGQISINLSRDGHFYMNTQINGVAVRFMVDTGASDIVLSLNDARNIGINPKQLLFNRRYQTANGLSFGAKVILDEMVIGDIKLQNIAASVNSSEMATSLLGMSFLQQCQKYEFYRDRLVLTFSPN